MQSEMVMSKVLLLISALLAVVFETAVFQEVPGLGYVVFWITAVVGTLVLLNSAERLKIDRLWMFLPSLLFSFSVFQFDAEVVRLFGAGLALATLAWAVAWNLLPNWSQGCLAYLLPGQSWNPIAVAGQAKAGLNVDTRIERETVTQTVRGLLLSGFLLLVFGILLTNADQVFRLKIQGLFGHLEYLSPVPMVRELLWMGVSVGLLRLWLQHPAPLSPRAKSIFGTTELSMALGSLNLLLLSFLMVQAHYLFGDATLAESLGLNHADYARRGFFELSLCIALILPLVLVAYRAAEVHRAVRLRFLGGGLILSAFGLAVSALKRMMMYIDAYGLSVERFYAAAGILVAMTVLGWAAYACWRPQTLAWLLTRQKVTVLFLLSLISLVNVDAVVARSQLRLSSEGPRGLDDHYLSQLSADALPVMDEFEPLLKSPDRDRLALARAEIVRRRGRELPFLSFNISRQRAALALEKMDAKEKPAIRQDLSERP